MLDQLNDVLAPHGMFVRGGFHPGREDDVPALPDGGRPGTLLLVGNAGAAMWEAFAADADFSGRDPLDRWLRPRIEAAASAAGADAVLLPNEGPPYPPVHEWAVRAEPVHRSPVGILIHPEFGLWHVYRAALLFRRRLALPPRPQRPSPCDACDRKPCLAVCPAEAFLPDRFDVRACVSHVESAAGANCRERGCLARRACPVGRDYAYPVRQQAFHAAAMLRAARRVVGDGHR